MEANRITIPYKSRSAKFELIPVGDIHCGNKAFAKEYFENLMKWIQKKDNVYVIGMGDYVEATTHLQPWFRMGEIEEMANEDWQEKDKEKPSRKFLFTQAEQFKYIKKWFKPIADSERLIGMHLGNHDERGSQYTGFDFVKNMCFEFGVPYLMHEAITRVSFKRTGSNEVNSWDVFSTHGKYRGTSVGGKVNHIEKYMEKIRADIFLHGDTHENLVHEYPVQELNARGTEVIDANKQFIMTGSFVKSRVKGTVTYSERGGYKSVKVGCPKLIFVPNHGVVELRMYSTDGWKEW